VSNSSNPAWPDLWVGDRDLLRGPAPRASPELSSRIRTAIVSEHGEGHWPPLAYFIPVARRRSRTSIRQSLVLSVPLAHARTPNGEPLPIERSPARRLSPRASPYPGYKNRKPGDWDSYPPGLYIGLSQKSKNFNSVQWLVGLGLHGSQKLGEG